MNGKHNRKKKFSGFTLIELLVTIAIIAILTGMLLPVLSSARKTAMGLNCTSNLKTLGHFLMVYSGNWGDLYPLAVHDAAGGWYDSSARIYGWYQSLYFTQYGKTSMNFQSRQWRCPLHPDSANQSAAWPQKVLYRYNDNYAYLDGLKNPKNVKAPTTIPMISDGPLMREHSNYNRQNMKNNSFVGNWHRMTHTNTWYMDGHIGLHRGVLSIASNGVVELKIQIPD